MKLHLDFLGAIKTFINLRRFSRFFRRHLFQLQTHNAQRASNTAGNNLQSLVESLLNITEDKMNLQPRQHES